MHNFRKTAEKAHQIELNTKTPQQNHITHIVIEFQL